MMMIWTCHLPGPKGRRGRWRNGETREDGERARERRDLTGSPLYWDSPLPTFMICSTRAYSCTFAARRHHIPLPGEAVRRNANSRWNMSTAVRMIGRCESNLNTSGEEI